MLHSAIYTGTLRHRRFHPCRHEFTYDVFMMYLDLDELPSLFDGVPGWSSRSPSLAWFKRSDYFGDARVPLADCIRDRIEAEVGERPEGPIRMLTNMRYFGYVINPVTFYYVFDTQGDRVRWILADVTNTPWGETYQYVITVREHVKTIQHAFKKAFHVSPFLPVDMMYEWKGNQPDEKLGVHMTNSQEGQLVIDATLSLKRKKITKFNLLKLLVSYPFMTVKVVLGIYWQALRLWLKGAVFYSHPEKS